MQVLFEGTFFLDVDGPEPTSLVAVTGLDSATPVGGSHQLVPIHKSGWVEPLTQAHGPFFDNLPQVPADVDSRFTRLLRLIPAVDRTARPRTPPSEEESQSSSDSGAVPPPAQPEWKRFSFIGGHY